MKRRTRVARSTGAMIAAIVTAAGLSIAVPMSAGAASESGTLGCAGKYVWQSTSAGAPILMDPAGGEVAYLLTTSGSYLREAIYTNGVPKLGGGSWSLQGFPINARSNYCSTLG